MGNEEEVKQIKVGSVVTLSKLRNPVKWTVLEILPDDTLVVQETGTQYTPHQIDPFNVCDVLS